MAKGYSWKNTSECQVGNHFWGWGGGGGGGGVIKFLETYPSFYIKTIISGLCLKEIARISAQQLIHNIHKKVKRN